ncbi:MAG: hypothetical protein KJ593_01575 [Candidatus Omnitrophica bacterium]|nr:hypothetical protein [Candidatus Omnitrophota bacterium]
MKKLADVCIPIAIASIVLGIISRIMFRPLFEVGARGFLGFATVMLLLAIAITLKEKA